MRWFIDGNNVMGARADGWWNDPPAAVRRLAQHVAEWCRTHGDAVTLVFDRPVDATTLGVSGGNLTIEAARRHGRDAADDHIVDLVIDADADSSDDDGELMVVTSDRGLRRRLPVGVRTIGAGRFLAIVDGKQDGGGAPS